MFFFGNTRKHAPYIILSYGYFIIWLPPSRRSLKKHKSFAFRALQFSRRNCTFLSGGYALKNYIILTCTLFNSAYPYTYNTTTQYTRVDHQTMCRAICTHNNGIITIVLCRYIICLFAVGRIGSDARKGTLTDVIGTISNRLLYNIKNNNNSILWNAQWKSSLYHHSLEWPAACADCLQCIQNTREAMLNHYYIPPRNIIPADSSTILLYYMYVPGRSRFRPTCFNYISRDILLGKTICRQNLLWS